MAEVKVSDPIKAPVRYVTVGDMSIEVGQPPWKLEMDIDLLFGENAQNTMWRRQQYPYLWVRKIDGEEVWPLQHYSEFLALRERLGRDGYVAVMEAVAEILQGNEDAVKNSPSTPTSGDAAA